LTTFVAASESASVHRLRTSYLGISA
jgi:hypothetical protein